MRREVQRQLRSILMNEGFFDAIKKKVGEIGAGISKKAKEYATSALRKIMDYLQKFLGTLKETKSNPAIQDALDISSGLPSVVSEEEISKLVPGYAELKSDVRQMKTDAAETTTEKPSRSDTNESLIADIETNMLLLDEQYQQLRQTLQEHNDNLYKSLLNEVVGVSILGVASALWGGFSTIVGIFGMCHFILNGLSKVASLVGLKNISKKLEHFAHTVHHWEEWFFKKTVLHPRILWATYICTVVHKENKDVAIAKQEMPFEKFKDDKKQMERFQKLGKAIIFIPLAFGAISHAHHFIVNALNVFNEAGVAAGVIAKGAYGLTHAGVEAKTALSSVAKLGSDATNAHG